MGVIVRQKEPGRGKPWWVFIAHNGKRTSRKVGDKQAAEKVASKIRAELKLGEFNLDEKRIPLFKHCAKGWIETTVPANCKATTAGDYEALLDNHILDEFGDIPVDKITRGMIKRFLQDKFKSGVSASTVKHIKSCISGVFNCVVDDDLIPANPCHRLGKTHRTEQVNNSVNPLSRKELTLLLKAFKKHYRKDYPLALLLARTGMRIGEGLALQWGDVDFNSRFITVQRSITNRGKIETPKNDKSRRVDMSKQLAQTLLDLKHQRKLETVKKGWGQMPEWIFINKDGNPLDKNNWRKRVFEKALEKAKLRKIRVHDMRHTYASLLLEANESLAYIRDQLGHHSIKVTVDIYGHLTPGGNKDAVDRLDDDDFFVLSSAPQVHPVPSENKKEVEQSVLTS